MRDATEASRVALLRTDIGIEDGTPGVNMEVEITMTRTGLGLPVYDAAAMLSEVTSRHAIHLSVLVAETALWASPEVHHYLSNRNGTGALYPYTRRYREAERERNGTRVGGLLLDDNTYANEAVKGAIGVPPERIRGFEACHIWPGTCYDPRYHTTIANLVLLPRALAGLSDYDREVQAALQYRAYELYGWYPSEEQRPERPTFYPSCWLDALPFTAEISRSLARRGLSQRYLQSS